MTTSRKPSPCDLGLETIQHVFESMTIDPKWSVWEDRGFTWWGLNCAQRVWCEPPVESGDFLLFRLHARTDFLDGFDDSDAQLALLGRIGARATLSGMVQDDQVPGRIQLSANLMLHTQNRVWAGRLFGIAVAIQAAEAQLLSQILDGQAGFRQAATTHPRSGRRTERDQMLSIIETFIRPTGELPCRYISDEFNFARQLIQGPPCIMANSTDTGLTIEYPFPGQSSLLQFETREPHRRLGNGLRATLRLPSGSLSPETTRKALALNNLEARVMKAANMIGSWTASDTGLVFTAYFPNCLHSPNVVTNVVLDFVSRARWVTETVWKYDMTANFEAASEQALRRITQAAGLPAKPSRKH